MAWAAGLSRWGYPPPEPRPPGRAQPTPATPAPKPATKPRLTPPSALQQNIGTRKMTRERNVSCTQPSWQLSTGRTLDASAFELPAAQEPTHASCSNGIRRVKKPVSCELGLIETLESNRGRPNRKVLGWFHKRPGKCLSPSSPAVSSPPPCTPPNGRHRRSRDPFLGRRELPGSAPGVEQESGLARGRAPRSIPPEGGARAGWRISRTDNLPCPYPSLSLSPSPGWAWRRPIFSFRSTKPQQL